MSPRKTEDQLIAGLEQQLKARRMKRAAGLDKKIEAKQAEIAKSEGKITAENQKILVFNEELAALVAERNAVAVPDADDVDAD